MNAYQGAWKKGYIAKLNHHPCIPPYEDKRTRLGRLTFSQAFRKAWFDGYEAAAHDMALGDNDGWYDERIQNQCPW